MTTRSEGFFADELPEFAALELTRPSCREPSTADRVEEVSRRESAARKRGSAMGMKRVLKQNWNSSPTTFERRRGVQPTIAGLNKWARIEALQRSADWLRAYKEALTRFVREGGSQDVEFPLGTWWMCARLGCKHAAA